MIINRIDFYYADEFWTIQFTGPRTNQMMKLLARREDFENLGIATAEAIGFVLSLPCNFERGVNPVGRIINSAGGEPNVEWNS
jgi:hypothetical protein